MVKRSDYVQINSIPGEGEEEEEDLNSDIETSPFPTQPLDQTMIRNGNNNNKIRSNNINSNPTTTTTTAAALQQDFNKWTKNIANKVQIKKRNNKKGGEKKNLIEDRNRDLPIEIMISTFEVWQKQEEGKGKGKELNEKMITLDHLEPMSREIFDGLAERVKEAIEQGVQPRLNSKGSSGSYFARDPSGSTIGIFKPKDEEPYGRLNPKLTKWIHRNFLSKIIPFGRACLIPQLSYLSESAASLMDRRLQANIVPRTEVVDLTSPAFYYDWIDRERVKKGGVGNKQKKLPEKPGSFQVFLKGFTDATLFLRNHPYPGRPLSQTLDTSPHRKHRINLLAPCSFLCGKADAEGEEFDEQEEVGWGWGGEDDGTPESRERRRSREEAFKWTDEMMKSFRLELEKLVIFDYIIRNTDRGLDNFMIKGCMCSKPSTSRDTSISTAPLPSSAMSTTEPFTSTSSSSSTLPENRPHVHIAAIDNSLAFPHQHPIGYRSYPYGWLYLPVSLIGIPFSKSTREHYLPLLSSPTWWSETTLELRKEFSKDPDFSESMFRKQMAVMKGQAWNIVQSLKDESDGPLELCRRGKKLVWDDLIEVSDDQVTRSLISATSNPKLNETTIASTTTQDFSPPNSPPSPPTKESLEPPLSPLATHPPRTDFSPSSNPPPTRPVSLKRTSSERTRPSTKSLAGIGRRASVLSASVLLPEEDFDTLTGAEMMKRLDRVEAEERYGGISENEEYDYGSDGDDFNESIGIRGEEGDISEWGVRSENDIRRSSASVHSNSKNLSFDLERNETLANGGGEWKPRHRSGSLSSILGVGLGIGKSSRRKNSGGSNRKYSRESDVEGEGKKVVVVERMESVDSAPVFSWF